MNQKLFEELKNRPHPLAEVENLYEPSQTIPNMDMRPQEIIERYVRHLPVPISYRQTFVIPDGVSEDDALDYVACQDEFEVFDYHKRLQFDLEKNRSDYLKRQQQQQHQQQQPQQQQPQQQQPQQQPQQSDVLPNQMTLSLD